jgi:hypothetical protein
MDLYYLMQAKVYSEIIHKFTHNIFNSYFNLLCKTTLVVKNGISKSSRLSFCLLHSLI